MEHAGKRVEKSKLGSRKVKIKLIPVESKRGLCEGCYLRGHAGCDDAPCTPSERGDDGEPLGMSVIWVRQED